jgi:hypothetical protein
MLKGFWAGLRAEILLVMGDAEGARAQCDAGIEHSHAVGEPFYVPALLRVRAAATDDPVAARADLEDAVSLAREQGAGLLEARAQAALRELEAAA